MIHELPEELREFTTRQVEKARRGMILAFAEKAPKVTVHEVRKLAGTAPNVVSACLRLHRAGKMPPLFAPWGDMGARRTKGAVSDPTPSAEMTWQEKAKLKREFADAVKAATTDEERERLAHDLTALTALSVYAAPEANAMKSALAQATVSAKAKRDTSEDSTRHSMVLCTDESWRVVRLYDGIVCDERRKKILRYLIEECHADLEERPNVDLGGAQ